jgi:hypothetical protein
MTRVLIIGLYSPDVSRSIIIALDKAKHTKTITELNFIGLESKKFRPLLAYSG